MRLCEEYVTVYKCLLFQVGTSVMLSYKVATRTLQCSCSADFIMPSRITMLSRCSPRNIWYTRCPRFRVSNHSIHPRDIREKNITNCSRLYQKFVNKFEVTAQFATRDCQRLKMKFVILLANESLIYRITL